jgi:two-component system response regulator YesN
MWKIVIVDDDRGVLQGMKHAIPWETLDADWVGEAMDGQQGLELVRTVKPDIVITDIYMPVMGGIDMIEKLREQKFPGKIVIHSGYSDFEYARQALRLSVEDYLSKPVSVATLREVLGRAIQSLEEEMLKQMEQEDLGRRLMLYEPFVAREWLKAAVTGTLDKTYPQSRFLPDDCEYWTARSHLVYGIDIVRTVRVSEVTTADWNLFRFAVSNVLQEVVLEHYREFDFVELHSSHAAVVLHLQPGFSYGELATDLRNMAKRMIRCVYEVLGIVIQIGIGTLKEEWQNIADSTEEAFLALADQTHAPYPHVDLYEYISELGHQLEGEQVQTVIRPIKFYQQLTEAVKGTRVKEAMVIIEDYMAQLSTLDELSPSDLQRLGSELWTIFAFTLSDVGLVLDEMFPELRLHKELSSITSPMQLGEWLADKVKAISGNRQWNENLRHKQAVDFMTQYIHEHYAKEITLADLADKVFLSRNYLSHIFKHATGETFNNYLTRVRMEKAKELILQGKLLIYEIAERVGYKNVPYFSTLFKKNTGLNPTDLVR